MEYIKIVSSRRRGIFTIVFVCSLFSLVCFFLVKISNFPDVNIGNTNIFTSDGFLNTYNLFAGVLVIIVGFYLFIKDPIKEYKSGKNWIVEINSERLILTFPEKEFGNSVNLEIDSIDEIREEVDSSGESTSYFWYLKLKTGELITLTTYQYTPFDFHKIAKILSSKEYNVKHKKIELEK